MSKILIYIVSAVVPLTIITVLCLGCTCQAESAVGGGENSLASRLSPRQPLNLTLRDALTAAVDNNPDVLLYRERIEAARGQMQTQLGTLLPNLSSMVRQTRQTQFRGTFGLDPVRSDPFSIFDARINASQNLLTGSAFTRSCR